MLAGVHGLRIDPEDQRGPRGGRRLQGEQPVFRGPRHVVVHGQGVGVVYVGDELLRRPVEAEVMTSGVGPRGVLEADGGGWGGGDVRHVLDDVCHHVRYLLDRRVRPWRTGVPLVHEVVRVHLQVELRMSDK